MIRVTFGKNSAFAHHVGAVAYTQRFADIVVGNEYSDIALRELANVLRDLAGEALSGAIAFQKLRIRFDRAGLKTVMVRFANLDLG